MLLLAEKPYACYKGKMELVLPKILADNSADCSITDPPYNLGFMGKEWDKHKSKAIDKMKGEDREVIGIRKHPTLKGPTVKPTELMRWLVRMFCFKDGICLDPFQGSGSTGKACMYENRKYIGIDMDFDIGIAKARIEFAIRNRNNQLPLYV